MTDVMENDKKAKCDTGHKTQSSVIAVRVGVYDLVIYRYRWVMPSPAPSELRVL